MLWALAIAMTVAGCSCGDDDEGDDDDDVDGGVDARDDRGNDADGGGDGGPPGTARETPTNGSAIVATSDNAYAVATNRFAGTISVLEVTTGAAPAVELSERFDVDDDEPWAAIMGNDDDTAYVVLRKAQQVVRIDGVKSATPTLAEARGTTGAEPTGIAISPTGALLYVTNWGEGTVTVLDAATLETHHAIDLNGNLQLTASLGASAGRPALAHPRNIVITNDGDGDDEDETIYVSEYFGIARPLGDLPSDDSRFDVARVGLVYRIDAGTNEVGQSILFDPFPDTGFVDSTGGATGCFPNQLGAITINSGRLYVSALCESPRGPTGPVIDMATGLASNTANFKTQIHTAILVADTETNEELHDQSLLLTREFTALYDAGAVADDGTRRMPLIASDISFVPESRIAYITSYGSDAVFRIAYGEDGTTMEVGASSNKFINLNPGGGVPPGQLPIGIWTIGGTTSQALVLNEATFNVSFLSFATQSVVAATEVSPRPADGTEEHDLIEGRRFFATGLGRWSFKGQGWNSCETCHGDGLTDNVTWFFARGPRQTTSLDGTFGPDGSQRLLNWTAIFDEVHDFELNTRGNSGGLGAIVHAVSMPPVAADRIHFDGSSPTPAGQMATATPQAGLNGSTRSLMPDGTMTPKSVLDDWDRINAWVRTIRAPRAPTNLVPADVTAGRELFVNNNCAACHGGSSWTVSRRFWSPGETANNGMTGALRSTNYSLPSGYPAALNPPAAMGPASLRFPAGMTAAANDQIQCALRAVGTFPPSLDSGQLGIAPTGVLVREVRADMTTNAQGASGFNPPALVGMSTGAPYFHAGNARTLEELFSTTFNAHHGAHAENFLETGDRDEQIRQITAFLLSIDDDTDPVEPPSLGFDTDLCPDSL